MPSETTRDSLLDAAQRVMQRDGSGNLTLDAVAREAKVSKGGLLYHFPSKSDLLRGMIAKGSECMRVDLEAQMGQSPGPHPFAQALLRLSVFGPPETSAKPPAEMIWSMMAATANDPSLLTPIREAQAELGRRLAAEGIDLDAANLIRLVGRGLWMTDIFGFEAPDEASRRRLHDLIARLGGLETAFDAKDQTPMENE